MKGGKGKGREHGGVKKDEEKKPLDKSKVKCYDSQKLGILQMSVNSRRSIKLMKRESQCDPKR